jgi:cobyrinic acid a,c-diamide synthase
MAGVLPGTGFPTDRLQRFGYLTVLPEEDSLLFRRGEEVPAHEFHYWDCTVCGEDLTARKSGGRTWRFGSVGETLYAAFPHLHFGGSVPLAQRFIAAAARHRQENL